MYVFKQMPTFDALFKIYGEKFTSFIKNHKYFSSFQKLYQCEIRLQEKINK